MRSTPRSAGTLGACATVLAFAVLTVTAPSSSQSFPNEPGWVELSPRTTVRSAERVHRMRLGDRAPVDLLYLSVGGASLHIDALEVTRADGTTQRLEIGRSMGSGAEGIYLVVCGGPAPLTRAVLRHLPSDPRVDTVVSLRGRARTPSTTGALELPCEAHPEAIAATPIEGYPWGATLEAVRTRCVADGAAVTQPNPLELVCTPFRPLSGTSARFRFHDTAPTGLHFVEVTRARVPLAALRDTVRAELGPWLSRLGRPRIRVFPDHCDLAFFDTPATCGVATPMNVHYTWTGPSGYVALDTEQVGHEHVVRVSFSRPSS